MSNRILILNGRTTEWVHWSLQQDLADVSSELGYRIEQYIPFLPTGKLTLSVAGKRGVATGGNKILILCQVPNQRLGKYREIPSLVCKAGIVKLGLKEV